MTTEQPKKKFQLAVMREDSETAHHITVDASTLSEALTIFRQDYPHMKDYVYESYKIL